MVGVTGMLPERQPAGLPMAGAIARTLAEQGLAGLPGVLRALAHTLGAQSAAVRDLGDTGRPGRPYAAVSRPRVADPGESLVEVPLRAGGRALGVLSLTGPPGWVPDRSVLDTVADILALALCSEPSALAGLAPQLLLAAEEDRAAIAGELHDGPVQALVAARYIADLSLGAARRQAAPDDAAAVAEALAPVREAIQNALRDVRRTMTRLRPRALDGRGLAAALTLLTEHAGASGELTVCLADPLDATGDAPLDLLPPAVAVTVFRIVQAALDDAAARGARDVSVRVRRGRQEIEVDVRDDAGPPAGPLGAPPVPSDALRRWRTRAGVLGGWVAVDPTPVGIRVSAWLPVPEEWPA